MSRRRDADKAEAIVKSVGAIFMLLLLLGLMKALPGMLKGKKPNEMLDTMFGLITGFVLLSLAIAFIGLIVWLVVLRGKGQRGRLSDGNIRQDARGNYDTENSEGSTPACPECGEPMEVRRGKWGPFWSCPTYPVCKGKRSIR